MKTKKKLTKKQLTKRREIYIFFFLEVMVVMWSMILAGAINIDEYFNQNPEIKTEYTPDELRELYQPVIIKPFTTSKALIEKTVMEGDMESVIQSVGESVGLSQGEINRFKRLAYCESRYNPNAVSSTNDHGLLQINARYWDFDRDKIYNPEYNVNYAMTEVYPRQGFSAWACNSLI